jgi:molecular chaperone GrpE
MTSAAEPEQPKPEPAADEHEGGAAEAASSEAAEEEAVQDDLDAMLSDVRRERDEYLALAQRAKADFENYRKRAARDASQAERRGKASLARELLPAIDNLERAVRSAGEGEQTADGDSLLRGVALIHSELQSTLARAGVEAYDPVGDRFDPAAHEAISTKPAENGVDAGTVVETLERGYRIDGQVLRPARVIVSE